MNLGTALHKQVERHFTHGDSPDHPSVIEAVKQKLLPDPTTYVLGSLLVERPIDGLFLLSDVPVHGRADLIDLSDANAPHIYDIKTTSNIGFARTPKQLQTDLQLSIYANAAGYLQSNDVVLPCRYVLSHVYLLTGSTPGAKPRTTSVTPAQVEDTLYEASKEVDEMKEAATSLPINYLDIACNTDACNDYRRKCPFYSLCHEGKSMTSFKEELEAAGATLEVPDSSPAASPRLSAKEGWSVTPSIKYTTVTVSKTKNLGNFESKRLELTAEVGTLDVSSAYEEVSAKVEELLT